MAEELRHQGEFKLINWKTTNKVEEDAEVLTGYAKFAGIVPGEWFASLTSTMGRKTFESFFWEKDKAPAYPAMGQFPINAELDHYIVEFGSGIRYTENNATIRAFKFSAVYGRQWSVTFEVLVHPKTESVTGRFAARENHDISIELKGYNQDDLFSNQGDGGGENKAGGKVVDIETGGKGSEEKKAPEKKRASKRDPAAKKPSGKKGDGPKGDDPDGKK